jgi:hypothetical protein
VGAASIETSSAEGASALPVGNGSDSLSAEISAAVAAVSASRDETNDISSFGGRSSDAAGASLDVFVDESADAFGGTTGFPFGAD